MRLCALERLSKFLYNLKESRIFQFVVISIIILNAITIGVNTYELSDLTRQAINYLDYSITIFFVIEIIIAGMVAPTTHGAEYKKKFDAIYPKLSKKYNLPLIPFLLEGVALDPSLNQQDGIHPNKEGTIKVSETIKKSIINILN